ncbi:MAG: energy transducer TonB [Candidatus Omnitrophota bacterium]|nr:energy transducer TonB [Candidatus Omnitrophota bacterium]
MVNPTVIKAAFLISLGAHSLLFMIPRINLPASKIEPTKKIEITITKPNLLPKVDQLGEEKKLKATKNEPTPPKSELKKQEKITRQPHNEPIKIEDPDTQDILRYQDMIKRKIQKARRYPQWAKQKGYQGSTYLKFTILKNGYIHDIRILQSSGYRILDEEALSTLIRAQPFPKIPKKIPFSKIHMEIYVVFQLSTDNF